MKLKKGFISIAIPVLNEEKNIGKCLELIFSQNFNIKKIEVFIVDAGCNDKTIEIAKKFNVKILDNKIKKDYDSGKMIALNKAKGEYFMYLDADMFLLSKNWFNQMLKVFKNKEISASFTKFIVVRNDNILNRYLSYDPLQRDPLYKFLTSNIDDIITKKEDDYFICKIRRRNPPPIGLCVYRTYLLKKYIHNEGFQDLEVPLILESKGYGIFAYVPNAGVHHKHVRNLKHLMFKRFRNINIMGEGKVGYIPNYEKRMFKWVDLSDKKSVFKLFLWVIYANLFIPLLLTGIYKMIKYRDYCFILEPITGLLVTDTVTYGFIKNKKGRKLILK